MRHLTSRNSSRVLELLAKEKTLCAFDYDGTLAPIADHPGDVRMRRRTRQALKRLTSLYPCVVLSGRSRRDLLRSLGSLKFKSVIGSHGADRGSISPKILRRVRKWKKLVDSELRNETGLYVEDKGLSLAVHYRQSPRKADARRKILRVVSEIRDARVIGGKQVVNLLADDGPTKGAALTKERDALKCTWVLYVGDDQNDEDAFAIDGNIVPVRIGRKRKSRARFYLRTQDEVDDLLERLAQLRSPAPLSIRRRGTTAPAATKPLIRARRVVS